MVEARRLIVQQRRRIMAAATAAAEEVAVAPITAVAGAVAPTAQPLGAGMPRPAAAMADTGNQS